MKTESLTIACLSLRKVPNLLFNPSVHEAGECDYCGRPILAPKDLQDISGTDDIIKSCPACIAARLDIAWTPLSRHMYGTRPHRKAGC